MIQSIDLQNLRNGEYSQLIQDILNVVALYDTAAMKVDGPFNDLQKTGDELEAIFKLPPGSAFTAELEQLDELRDNALRGIQSIVLGHTYGRDAVIKTHAQLLLTHLGWFGSNIAKDSYQSETSSIRNIIADWNARPELTAAIKALGLQGWQKDLEEANNSFSEKYVKRAVERGTDETESFKAKRMQANNAYYALRDEINAHYTLTRADEPYKTVVAAINGLLNFYNDLLARRAGSNGEPATDAADKPAEAEV